MLEYQNGQMAINPRFNKLITALRTAVEKGEETWTRKQLVTMMYWMRLGCLCRNGLVTILKFRSITFSRSS